MSATDGAGWGRMQMGLPARSLEVGNDESGRFVPDAVNFPDVSLKELSSLPIKPPDTPRIAARCWRDASVSGRTGMTTNVESTGSSERRRHRRFECDGHAEVVVFDSNFLFRGDVRDISLTGCYIETRAHLKLQRFAEVELRFTANGQHLNTLARVMVIRPGKGAGFEFLPGDPRLDKPFQKLIEKLGAGAPAQS